MTNEIKKQNLNEEDDQELIEKISGIIGNKALVINCGQGGSRLGSAISLKFKTTDSSIYINTSMKDITGIGALNNKRVIKLGDNRVEGAGKDRTKGNEMLTESKEIVFNEIRNYLLETAYDFVFVVFSTSGGTGGGIGPKITALVNSDPMLNPVKEKYGYTPIVFGIAALPEICSEEGNISYKNTLLCLNDIKKFVINETGRYILVNNGFDIVNQRGQNRVSKLDSVNASVATVIYRYFTEYGISRISNYDRADRIGALSTMGLHSFLVLDGNGNRTAQLNPFFIPDGERVKRVCYEVPENMEKTVSSQIAQTGVISDDQIHGLYDLEEKENSGLIPVIGFHGFKNIDKISEQYEKRIKLNEENARRIEESNILSSTGLDSIDEIVEQNEKEYGSHGAKSIDDIFD